MEHLNIFNTSIGIFIRMMINIPLILILGLYCYSFAKQRKKQSYATITNVSLIYSLMFTMLLATYFILILVEIEPSLLLNKFLIATTNTYIIFIIFGVYRIFQSNKKVDTALFGAAGSIIFMVSLLSDIIGSILTAIILGMVIFRYHKNLYHRKIMIAAIVLYIVSSLTNIFTSFNGLFSLIGSLFMSSAITLIIFNLTMYSFYLVQQKQRSSMIDSLTGLYNRAALSQAFEHYLKINKEPGILFIDIDNFKKLNDTQGHKKGDEVLHQVSKICEQLVHNKGIAARYGGEEIILLIYDKIDLIELASTLVRTIQQTTCVTVSVGVREFEPYMTLDHLIKDADTAMYQAKTTGKNKFVVHTITSVIDALLKNSNSLANDNL